MMVQRDARRAFRETQQVDMAGGYEAQRRMQG